ncbi:CYTH-like domain-containing protein [Chaetomium sp. MPI-CAGE-AT-0009]|nr:CYTH-like domain-containing protein [Chaetomium sp. MPI-CAGE-AT-0009]
MATALRATRALLTALPKPRQTTAKPTTPPTILEVERKFRRLTVPTLTGLTTTTATTTTTTTPTIPTTIHQPLFQSVLPLPTRTIHDTYYDTPHHALSAAGAWVRRRDGLWEAKLRRGGDFVNSRFEEVTGEEAVRGCVVGVLGLGGDLKGDLWGQQQRDGGGCFGLVVMADLVTTREAWLVDGEFRVVRDVMDFGHEVGEVELQVEVDGSVVGEEEKRGVMEGMDRRVEGFMERQTRNTMAYTLEIPAELVDTCTITKDANVRNFMFRTSAAYLPM